MVKIGWSAVSDKKMLTLTRVSKKAIEKDDSFPQSVIKNEIVGYSVLFFFFHCSQCHGIGDVPEDGRSIFALQFLFVSFLKS